MSFSTIKEVVGHPTIDMPQLGKYVQESGSGGSTKDQLVSEIDRQYGNMIAESKELFLRHVVEKIYEKDPQLIEDLTDELQKHGWNIIDGNLILLEILEPMDFDFVPAPSHPDLLEAANRIREGKLSAAVTSACGAVETVCNKLGVSNTRNDNFQKRVKEAIEKTGCLKKIGAELKNLEWEDGRINEFIKNLKGGINQAAFVMQTLRSQMSDTHGTKEVFKPLAFDSIKWSMIICSLLKKN
ncbi:MAG: hypothetical protein IH886_13935 [Nitrospinae bacterium]|nr:hypothetical protein [Nitrospinota bacterium]